MADHARGRLASASSAPEGRTRPHPFSGTIPRMAGNYSRPYGRLHAELSTDHRLGRCGGDVRGGAGADGIAGVDQALPLMREHRQRCRQWKRADSLRAAGEGRRNGGAASCLPPEPEGQKLTGLRWRRGPLNYGTVRPARCCGPGRCPGTATARWTPRGQILPTCKSNGLTVAA